MTLAIRFFIYFAIWTAIVLFSIIATFFVPVFLEYFFGEGEGYILLLILPIYVAFAGFMFFYLGDKILRIPPENKASSMSKEELITKIESSFSQNDEKNGNPLFYISRIGDRVVVTWSQKINYNQIASLGAESKKRVFILTFNDSKKTVSLIQRDVDWQWNGSPQGFFMFLSFFQGFSLEWSAEYKPSFDLKPDGTIAFDIKKIQYSSDDILKPLERIISKNGWTLNFPIIANWYIRWLIILLVVIFSLTPIIIAFLSE
jgi:hypothetical protein